MTHGVKVGLKTLGLLYASSVKASVEECTKAFQWTLLVTLYVIVFIFLYYSSSEPYRFGGTSK